MGAVLNPEVMRWAVERSGISEDRITRKFGKYPEWLEGTHSPTLKQLMDFARTVHVHLCDLYNPCIPDYGMTIPDFRTVEPNGPASPSPELYDTIAAMRRRQQWMSDYFREEGYPAIPLVGAFSGRALSRQTAQELAGFLHKMLELGPDWATNLQTSQDAVKLLRDRIEARRISVAINGVVGNNTSRPLQVSEFRGFVLSDEYAPLIFINGKDAKGAQLFTMIHELAHLAFAQTGVVSPIDPCDEGGATSIDMERFCDFVAATFLVPPALAHDLWGSLRRKHSDDYDLTVAVARVFKVSFMVVCRQIHDTGIIGDDQFYELYRRHQQELSQLNTGAMTSGSGNPYGTMRYRLGSVYSMAVWSAKNSGELSLNDAYDMTGLTSKTFNKYYEELLNA